MKQSHEDSNGLLDEKIEKLTKEIEKTSVIELGSIHLQIQAQYFEKRYKEIESNLIDMK